MTTYSVTYRRDPSDDAWLVEVDGMPDVCTFGRTIEEAAVNAREAIAVTVDASESEVELEESFAVGGVDVEELAALARPVTGVAGDLSEPSACRSPSPLGGGRVAPGLRPNARRVASEGPATCSQLTDGALGAASLRMGHDGGVGALRFPVAETRVRL